MTRSDYQQFSHNKIFQNILLKTHPFRHCDVFTGSQRQDVHDHGADQSLLDLFRLARAFFHPPVVVVHADDQPLVLVAVDAFAERVAKDVSEIESRVDVFHHHLEEVVYCQGFKGGHQGKSHPCPAPIFPPQFPTPVHIHVSNEAITRALVLIKQFQQVSLLKTSCV